MKFWMIFLAAVVILALVFGKDFKQAERIAAKADTVRIRDSVRITVRDTLYRYLPRAAAAKVASDSADTRVGILNDSTLSVDGKGGFQPPNGAKSNTDSTLAVSTTITVPPAIVADIRALRVTVATQDTVIRWFHRKSAADSLALLARDGLIRELKPPRCGRKCGFAMGVLASVAVYKAVR